MEMDSEKIQPGQDYFQGTLVCDHVPPALKASLLSHPSLSLACFNVVKLLVSPKPTQNLMNHVPSQDQGTSWEARHACRGICKGSTFKKTEHTPIHLDIAGPRMRQPAVHRRGQRDQGAASPEAVQPRRALPDGPLPSRWVVEIHPFLILSLSSFLSSLHYTLSISLSPDPNSHLINSVQFQSFHY